MLKSTEIDNFLKSETKESKNNFVSKKTLFRAFKSETGSKIKAKEFKEYCDEHLKTKKSFYANDEKNHKKYIREAYEIEILINGKYTSDWQREEKVSSLKKVEGFVANVKNHKATYEIILMSKWGELLGKFWVKKFKPETKYIRQKLFIGSKIGLEYFKNERFLNVSDMFAKSINIHDEDERIASFRIRQFYRNQMGILSIFGKYEDMGNVVFDDELVA